MTPQHLIQKINDSDSILKHECIRVIQEPSSLIANGLDINQIIVFYRIPSSLDQKMYANYRFGGSHDLIFFSHINTKNLQIIFQKEIVYDNSFKTFEDHFLQNPDFIQFIKSCPLRNIPEQVQNYLLL